MKKKKKQPSCAAVLVYARSLLYSPTSSRLEFACQSVRNVSQSVIASRGSDVLVRNRIGSEYGLLLNESDAVILNPGDHVLALFLVGEGKSSKRADFDFLRMKEVEKSRYADFFPHW